MKNGQLTTGFSGRRIAAEPDVRRYHAHKTSSGILPERLAPDQNARNPASVASTEVEIAPTDSIRNGCFDAQLFKPFERPSAN